MIPLQLLLWSILATLNGFAYAEEAALNQVTTAAEPSADWHYGAYLDLSYVLNFNFPDNHLWRSRSTASRHNELAPNMGYVYLRKDASETSRWGTSAADGEAHRLSRICRARVRMDGQGQYQRPDHLCPACHGPESA